MLQGHTFTLAVCNTFNKCLSLCRYNLDLHPFHMGASADCTFGPFLGPTLHTLCGEFKNGGMCKMHLLKH